LQKTRRYAKAWRLFCTCKNIIMFFVMPTVLTKKDAKIELYFIRGWYPFMSVVCRQYNKSEEEKKMTNKKNTKKALLSSALSLLLCLSMLVGTTFAWFTDSVTSGRNKIQAGNLDVALDYYDAKTDDFKEVTSKVKLFNDDALWEPGHTEVTYLKVSNKGSLALKYQLAVNVYNEIEGMTKDGAKIKLSDYLVFEVVEIDEATVGAYDRDKAIQVAGTQMGLSSYNSDSKPLDPMNGANDEDYVALVIYMPTTVGNEANHDGTHIPKIELGTTLVATQDTVESDSFGTDYDLNATYPAIKADYIGGGEAITAGAVSVELPVGAAADDYVLKVENKNIKTENTGITTVSYDINLYKDDVKVEAVAGTKYIVSIYVGKGLNVTEVKHNGNSIATFDYNSATGEVVFETESFSPFEVVYYESAVDSKETLLSLVALGGEFKLTNDIVLSDDEIITIPEGKTVVLDMNGKKLSGSAKNVIYSQGDLTIVGSGAIEANKAGYSYAIRAQKGTLAIDGNVNVTGTFGCVEIYNGSIVTINAGNYSATGINGMTSHTVYVSGSTLTVNGGTFDSGYSSEGIDTICGNGTAKITLNDGVFYASELGANFFLKNVVVKGGAYQYNPEKFVVEGYKVEKDSNDMWVVSLPKASTASELQATFNEGGLVAIDGKITVEDMNAGVKAGTTVIGGTLSRDSGNGNPLTVYTTEKVTFDDVAFETVKGGAVLAVRKDNANVTVKNSTFNNLSSPSTGNTGVQVYAENVTMRFENCTFNNMPVVTTAPDPLGIKMEFVDCTFTWTGDNCPGFIQIANNLEIVVDITDCKFVYTTNSQYTTAKTMISYSWPSNSTININGLEVVGTRNNEKIWKICSSNNKVQINTSGDLSYTFNGTSVDFNTYLK